MLAAGFGELAAQLGARDGGDPVATVHAILAGYPAGWLLIFDNAPDPESVQGFVQPGGDGRVLITSRNALWPLGQGLEVPVRVGQRHRRLPRAWQPVQGHDPRPRTVTPG